MKFYDLHLHSIFSGGESSLEELASTAKELGYAGICFAVYYQDRRQMGIIQAEIDRVKKIVGIEILLGFEVRNAKELSMLRNRRKEFDLLLVRGGDLNLNRKACETPEVDILTHPEFERNDSGLNHIMLKLAAKNNVAVEVNFREILTATGKTRSRVLASMTKNIKLAQKYKTPIILCSGAISHWNIRSPFCLISMAVQLGMELKEAKEAISKVPENIIRQVEKRRSENWIRPGVEVIKTGPWSKDSGVIG